VDAGGCPARRLGEGRQAGGPANVSGPSWRRGGLTGAHCARGGSVCNSYLVVTVIMFVFCWIR